MLVKIGREKMAKEDQESSSTEIGGAKHTSRLHSFRDLDGKE